MAPGLLHEPPQHQRAEDMKQRVNRAMIKLSDRDTESMAASELESIARSLTPDSLPPFLSAISDTRPSDKTPLRRHSLRLLSFLSASLPASSLLPHLPRMLAAALRRLRDPDSSVRSSLVDAVRSMAASVPSALSPVLLRPLSDSLLHEQDHPAQIAAALSLSAAIDAASASASPSPDPDLPHHLQRLLPRLLKLLRSNAFKAKPALLSLLGSVAAAAGASTPSLLGLLLPCLVEFLSSNDWAARKAAAEALSRVALAESDHLGGFKKSCLPSFESRRFDKVKIVRDSMNQMLDLWKSIPDDESNGLLPPPLQSQSNSSRRESASDGRFPAASISSNSAQSASPFIVRKNRNSVSRSPPPIASPIDITTTRKNSTTPIRGRNSYPPSSSRIGSKRNSDWRIEITAPHPPSSEEKLVKSKEGAARAQEQGGRENNPRSKVEAKRMLFDEKSYEDKGSKMVGGLKSASRVVPFQESGNTEELTSEIVNATDELHVGHKDSDLSLIRMQLVQIENQQSSLLNLLQRFIGSSQNGIHCLETRVHGLEMALDVISRDLAVSSGRVSTSDPAVKTCCRLPGAEFLSSKFWRRAEGGRYSSRFSFSSANPTLADMHNLAEKPGQESLKWDKQRFGLQGGFVVNPLAEINPQSIGNTEVTPNKLLKSVTHDTEIKHARSG